MQAYINKNSIEYCPIDVIFNQQYVQKNTLYKNRRRQETQKHCTMQTVNFCEGAS